MNEDIVVRAVCAALLLVMGALLLWPRTPTQRGRRVERWSRTNLVSLSPQLAASLARAINRRNRAVGACALVGAAAVIPVADLGGPHLGIWMVIIGFGICTTVATVRQLQGPWIDSGQPRATRPRAVGLSDYVPPLMRFTAWAGAAVALISLPLLPLLLGGERLVVQMVLAVSVLAGVGIAEWTGRRVVARAQPAVATADLYAQDVWRSELAQAGFGGVAVCGGMVPILTDFSGSLQPALSGALVVVGWSLLVVAMISQLRSLRSANRVRARLWPQLAPGEFVGRSTGLVTS